jgi:chromosomal replication initiator protein
MEIVSVVERALADKVGKERFELWFQSGTRLQWDGHALTVGASNRFYLDWIRSSFHREIEAACRESFGERAAIKYKVDGPPACHTGGDGRAESGELRVKSGGHSNGADAQRPAAHAPLSTPHSRRRFASFSTFVAGPSNKLALVSAEIIARTPDQMSSLLIYGPTSVGKTHLLEGIVVAARQAGRTAVYLTAEQFTTQFLEALRGSGLPSFRRKYRGVALLIIDDLQFLAGKRATQVELLNTIDTLVREGQQIVFAADRPPAEMPEFTAELSTRLAAGMVCRIEPPDYATRLGIVQQLARRRGMELPAEVAQFIAARLTAHARQLSGAICRLHAASQAHGEKITLAMAEETLSEMIHHHSRVVRLDDIQNAVCKVFNLEPSSLQGADKSKRLSHPRMLAMWLARKHTRAALNEIGQFFGRRSHSTVISAQKRVDCWMASGEPLQLAERTWEIEETIRQLERQLMAS